MIGDLCLLQTTLGCLLFSSKWRQACGGWLPSTAPGPSWTSPDCGEKWNELPLAARHIYQVFKKQSSRQTNILPMRARYSSAETLIGRGAPVSCFWVSFPSGSRGGPSEPVGGPRPKRSCLFKRKTKNNPKTHMHLIWEVPGGEGNGNCSLCEPWWSETCWSRSVARLVLCLIPAWLMFSGCWRAFVRLLSLSYSAHSSQSIKPAKVLLSCFGLWCWDFVNLLPERIWVRLPHSMRSRGVFVGFLHKLVSSVGLVMCPIARCLLGDVSTRPDSDEAVNRKWINGQNVLVICSSSQGKITSNNLTPNEPSSKVSDERFYF